MATKSRIAALLAGLTGFCCQQEDQATTADQRDAAFPAALDEGEAGVLFASSPATPRAARNDTVPRSASASSSGPLRGPLRGDVSCGPYRTSTPQSLTPPNTKSGGSSGSGTSSNTSFCDVSTQTLEHDAAASRQTSLGSTAVSDRPIPSTTFEETYFTREVTELLALPLLEGDRQGRRPKHTFGTGATYEGQWKGNMRHGMGKQVWRDGARFVGSWKENAATGHGMFVHPDGDYFIGQWYCNSAQGEGTMYSRDGVPMYQGQWVHDVQHGNGVERWQGGEYRGQFVYGKKHGHGVFEWLDASKYMGDWRLNFIQGFGHYAAADGRQFLGSWYKYITHGCGQYRWPDGRVFSGQYVNDRKEGFGVFTWPGGRRYEGWWQEGKQHGPGILRAEDHRIVKQGMWTRGRPPAVLSRPHKSKTSDF